MLDDAEAHVPSPGAAAREALEATNNYREAAETLLARAKEDPELYEAIMGPHELPACLSLIRANAAQQRKAVWDAPEKKAHAERASAAATSRVNALSRSNTYGLLDFRLPGGLPLRDAKKADLLEAVKVYRQRADNMAHKARWLESIANQVGRKRVANAFSEPQLEQLQAETAAE